MAREIYILRNIGFKGDFAVGKIKIPKIQNS